jgi:hypothetical protein
MAPREIGQVPNGIPQTCPILIGWVDANNQNLIGNPEHDRGQVMEVF